MFSFDPIRDDPVALLFLVLGLGYVIGGLRIGSFRLGEVAGVLVAGLLLGHFGLESNPAIQSFGFVLFIFSVGYQAGPKFVQAIQVDGRRYLIIALVVAMSGSGLAYAAAKLLIFEPGVAAGLLAGSLTSTPTLAAADAAVVSGAFANPGGLMPDEVRSNITTAYAITYIVGLVGLILIIRLLPRAVGIDLEAEATRLEREEAAAGPQPVFSPSDIIVRGFRVEEDEITGQQLRELYESSSVQFTVLKILRHGEAVEPLPDTELQIGDLISIVGVLTPQAAQEIEDAVIGTPVRRRDLLHYQPESVQICVTRKDAEGATLGELQIPQQHAAFVSRVARLGVDLDVTAATTLERGDVLHVTGPKGGLEALGARLGHLEGNVDETDLRTFSWAIVLGILIGAWTISIAGIPFGLGSAGGLLAIGLAVGYLRSLFPVFGRVPQAARWVFTEMGLLLFMAGVGLRGGADLVETFLKSGLVLVVCGIIITVVPLALAYVIGRRLLGMHPLMLLGSITGAMTSGGALNVINAQAKSTIASIGYTGAYAFANVFLTIAGAVIMLL